MPRKPLLSLLLCATVLLAGCSVEVRKEGSATFVPIIITATLPHTPTSHPSETPVPPSVTPTVIPVTGTTSTQLNVRTEPSTVSEVLGVIAANTNVQIIGKDSGGNWWQILYETGLEGKGWVTAQYVETAYKPEVPVIGGDGENPNAGNKAIVIQQVNIRNGPGTNFNSIGILNPNDVVNLTGKNPDGTWLQIDFPTAPDSKGWISTAFVNADTLDALPIVSDAGEVVGTGTPMDTPLPPTPTIVPAPMDFDSADAPLKTILFDRAGTQTLIYNGDVSTPNGDIEDWIAFTPYNNNVFISVQCTGNGSLHVEVNTSEPSLDCNEVIQTIPVQAGTMHLIHIESIQNSDSLQYVNYTLIIKASQ